MKELLTPPSEIRAIWERGKNTYLPSALRINISKTEKKEEEESSSSSSTSQDSSEK